MNSIIDKDQMTEEDIKLNFITPALQNKGWNGFISMETKITDGKVNILGNKAVREEPKRVDYLLYFNKDHPIAVIEAKKNSRTVSFGMQQAIYYAQKLDLPFAYCSNGDSFYEHDFLTGLEREIPLDDFPTYDELTNRYKKEANNGKGLNESQIKCLDTSYYTSQTTFSPRYYQSIAINRTINAIANGQNRILLVMATGTGKTYTAFQIVYQLLKAKLKKKVLYLADRNILVDQSIGQDFNPLSNTIHKINFATDNPSTITSYEVYFSLYQQLTDREDNDTKDEEKDEEDTMKKLTSLFSPNFFDLVIVDECHRGSAKKDSNWRKILDYFLPATQIGMTATPKETKYISNVSYFGEPIYTYSLRDGIEDGFLAPYKVIQIKTNIGDGWRPCKGQKDKYGNEIEDKIYTNSDYDYKIVIEDRINQVAQEITNYLKQTDRMSKTIVFCATEEHAELMRIALSNLNSDMVKENPDYVVRITGSDTYGQSKIKPFISKNSKYPVIATTSKLLSTGADCKMVKLIVIDQMINSLSEFKQIIGRGTRLLFDEGKTHFTVMDFRGVSRLFADPDWDGPIKIDDGFAPDSPVPIEPEKHSGSKNSELKPYVDCNGCQVEIINKIVQIYDSDGRLLKTENIIDYTKTNILDQYASLENFIHEWSKLDKKEEIRNSLLKRGIDLEQFKEDQCMQDVDDFDFICHIAYDQKPLTRKERANNVKKTDFLSKYSGVARQVLDELLDKYMNSGICEIENIDVLKLDPLKKYGSPSKIVSYFGSKNDYLLAVKNLEKELYRGV